ncbi:MAG: hypothetical protein IJ343_02155, partial [Clostridia bacterium]|nr:hypothetical protein [Clostridia bacterium]
VAEFDDAASQFTTKNVDSLYSIQWLDENGEVLLTEKLLYRFTFANSWTTYDCARIKVNRDSITPHAGVDCTVADGSVTYRFAQDEAVVNLVTRFAAPESAVKYTLSELNVNGHIPRFDVADGFASYTLPPAVGVNRTLLLTWYDANSDILGGGVVTISSEGGLPSHTISLVPLSRMLPDDPPHGMVVKNQSTDGAYHIVIDDEQTDWDKVYTLSSPITWTDSDGNVTVLQEVMLGASVLELDEAASFRSVTYYDDLPQDDAALLEDLLQSEISALDYVHGWYWTVAAYDEATGAYTPYEMESSSGGSYLLAVQWLDEDGNVLLTEKMTYHIEHTQPGNTYPAALAPLAKDGIQPNIAGAVGVTCTLNDGSVAYAVSGDATVSTLSTAFTAPAGAKFYSFSEDIFDPWNDMMIISDGKAVHQLDLTSASEKTLIVAWYDEDWNILDGGAVTIGWEEGQAVQPASPFTFADNGDGTATVTGYTGTDTDAEVPAVYNGLTVTGIGSGAFAGSTLKRLILPDTIVNLADDAFSNYYRNIICSVGSPTATAITEAGRVFLAREDERLKLRQPLDEEGNAYLHLMVYYDTESSTITIPAEVNGVPITHIGPAFITTNCRQLELPGDDLQFLHPDAFDLYSQGHPTIFCNAGSLTAQTVSDFGSAFRSLDGEMLILMQHKNDLGAYELELIWYAEPMAATATVPASVNGVPITRLDEGVVTENCTTLVLP